MFSGVAGFLVFVTAVSFRVLVFWIDFEELAEVEVFFFGIRDVPYVAEQSLDVWGLWQDGFGWIGSSCFYSDSTIRLVTPAGTANCAAAEGFVVVAVNHQC